MKQSSKRAIVKDYIKHHNTMYRQAMGGLHNSVDSIFANIIGGNYGDCRIDGNEATIEIPARESYSGKPMVFTFRIDE